MSKDRRWEEILPPERWIVKKPPSRYRCRDGHMVKSKLERIVDDMIFSHSTPHEYEPGIPDTNLRADFKVRHGSRDWYIEVWGTKGRPSYDRNKEQKLVHYSKKNLNLIQINSEEEVKKRLDAVLGHAHCNWKTNRRQLHIWASTFHVRYTYIASI